MLFCLFLRMLGTIEAEEDVELTKQLRWPFGHLLSVPPNGDPRLLRNRAEAFSWLSSALCLQSPCEV